MATKDLLIDFFGDGDIKRVGFDLPLTASTSQWLQQKLWIKFKTFLGELWLNIEKGIPYHEAVLIKNPDLTFISTIFKEQILEEPLVDSLLSFNITNFDSLSRQINFSWKASMTTGEIIGGDV